MRFDKKKKNRAYILEFYFNHSTTVKFSSFWIMKDPNRTSKNNNSGRDRREKQCEILFLNLSNEPKILTKMLQALLIKLILHSFYMPKRSFIKVKA